MQPLALPQWAKQGHPKFQQADERYTEEDQVDYMQMLDAARAEIGFMAGREEFSPLKVAYHLFG